MQPLRPERVLLMEMPRLSSDSALCLMSRVTCHTPHTGALPEEFAGGVINALIMVVSLQASGNLVNSYIDHDYGVDTLETAGDRCDVYRRSVIGSLCVFLL